MFIVIWEFRVKPGCEQEFERLYGPDGDWSTLFGRGAGWLGTELLRDEQAPSRYLTIDRWESPEAYRQFQREFGGDYDALDARCEGLTDVEKEIGEFISG